MTTIAPITASIADIYDNILPSLVGGYSLTDINEILTKVTDSFVKDFILVSIFAALTARKAFDQHLGAAVRENQDLNTFISQNLTLNGKLKFSELACIGFIFIQANAYRDSNAVKAWISKVGSTKIHDVNVSSLSAVRQNVIAQFKNKFDKTVFSTFCASPLVTGLVAATKK